VDGRIQTRNYEGQDGKKVYVTEVQAESVQFLEPKGEKKQQEEAPKTKVRKILSMVKAQLILDDSTSLLMDFEF
jgi:single-stranded DNA-binding protein